MIKKNNLYFLFLVVWNTTPYSGSWGGIFGKAWGGIQTVGNTAKQVGMGFASMFGVVPPGYSFSFIVYNGLQNNVQVQTRAYKKVMGGRFEGNIIQSLSIAPGENSEDTFNNTPLYFGLEINSCNFDEAHYTLGVKNDSTVYVYHTFNDPDSFQSSAERLGVVSATSTDFSGLIYNGSGGTATVQFTWNKNLITVPVEANTFNALSSTEENPLRPSVLVLNGYNVILPAVGLGTTVTTDSSDPKAQSVAQPTRYNYQITPSSAIETGLFPGNYKNPQQQSQLRDITPITCQIWNQAVVSDVGSVWNLMPLDLPQQSLWFIYTGPGIDKNGNFVNMPIGPIPYGKCVNLTLLRPSASQQLAKLFLVRVNMNASNESEIVTFLTQLAHTKIPPLTVPAPSSKFIQLAENMLLTEKLPDSVGFLNNGAGLQGVIVGTDIFASYGATSNGPFYYSVTAPQFAIASVQSCFTQVIDNLTTQETKNLNIYIQDWVINYHQYPDQVRQSVEKFLIENGSKSIIIKNGDEERLSKSGYALLNTLLYGPVSISRMPIFYPIMQKTSLTLPAPWATAADTITL